MNQRLLLVAVSAFAACAVLIAVMFLFRSGGQPAGVGDAKKTSGASEGGMQIPVSLEPFKRQPETDWIAAASSNAMPFSIESQKYGSCYCQRIAFASGKTLPLYSYVSDGSSCDVFSLGDGMFLLVEGWKKDLTWRRSYRVNVSNETLEVAFENMWVKVPDGAVSITSIRVDAGEATIEADGAAGTVKGRECTPVADETASSVYVGTCWPDGRFAGPAGDGK